MAVVEALFKYTSVTQQALRSYDDFTTNKIPQIIDTKFNIETQLEDDDRLHTFHIHSPVFGEPSMVERDGETRVLTSTEAKLRDVTYSIPLYGKVTYTLIKKSNQTEISTKVFDNVHMARIPIMVASSLDSTTKHPSNMECDQDPGGYFIVNGKEKTLIIQETIRPNTVMVFSSKSRGIESVIYPRLDNLTMTNCTCKAYVKRNQIYMDTNGQYPMEKYPTTLKKVPLSLMLAVVNKSYDDLLETLLWGIDSEMEKLKIRAFVDPSFDEDYKYKAGVMPPPTRPSKERKAANIIHRAWYNYAVHNPLLNARLSMYKIHRKWESVLYPHDTQNAGEILLEQIKMLVYTTLGYRDPDSRDSEKNKRLCAAGTLLMTLMSGVWNQWIIRLKKTIQLYVNRKKQLRLQKLCDKPYITDSLKYAIATGNWRAKDEVGGKTGVAQSLNRQTYVSCIAQLRRVDSSVPTDTKVVEPRLLRGDVWGFRCPSATPEGQPNGLVTQLSVAARISVESPPDKIANIMKKFTHKTGKVPMYINGKFYGRTRYPNKAAQFLRKQRRSRTLPIDISVSIVDKKLIVFSDAGRIVRPVFIVRSVDDVGTTDEIDVELRSGRMTWDDLLSSGIVEYIDPQETENCLIALRECEVTPHHTHCEIHCSLILGVMANCIPFPEHNQSPRITYQCAMGKQAVGVYSSNYQSRFDTMANVLHYPQKPLVSTAINEHVSSDLVSGCNAIVAIMIYGGYNQEDSVLINQGSIDRGFGRLTSYRTYTGVDVNRGQKKHIFCKDSPSKTTIEDDGLPKPRSWVEQGDVLIGKKVGTRDASIINKKNAGYVDDVLIIQSDQGQTVKVKVRQTRVPELGDKLSSRHGQKGTIGLIIPEESMPYTRDGVRPDIIISPHALPSRMTVAHVLECLASKVASLNGIRQMATAFEHDGVYDYMEQLHGLGFQKHGDEVMYDGRTGEMLEGKVFLGPTYYQRLKHMVQDKIYSRSNKGHLNQLTRQPCQGRAKGGGLRFGEMERDVGLAYGAAYVLQDRMLKSSDLYSAPVCKDCGFVGTHVFREGQNKCCYCGGQIGLCDMPFATKQSLEELMSMGVAPHLDVKDRK